MMTQSHVAIGLLLFGRPTKKAAITGSIIGGIFPDFFMVPMFLIARFIQNQDMGQIWGVTYYAAPWWTIDQIANSAPVFVVLAAIAFFALPRSQHWWPKFLLAFSLTALVHVCFDFVTHATDGHIHFWPLSDFVFNSPVSYYEEDYFGLQFGVAETLSGLIAAVLLFFIYRGWAVRAFAVVLALLSFLGFGLSMMFILNIWEQTGPDGL